MRNELSAKQRILLFTAGALLLAGCVGFKPVADAPIGVYAPPRDANSAEYHGMSNRRQVEHLRNGKFPRLTESERILLRRVNREVNDEITYLSDEDNYGCIDFPVAEPRLHHPVAWGLPTARYGDCEDYALTKKKRIVEQGMEPSRLFVVRAKVPTDAGLRRHIVLAVPEGSDWWILNNWDNRIEAASYLIKWWGWNFDWPPFDEYRRVARARNGTLPRSG